MIRLSFSLVQKGVPTPRSLQKHVQAGLRAAVDHWRNVFLPQHFEPFARAKYGYRPRSRKYREKKERMAKAGSVIKGGKADLVFRGLLERSAESLQTVKVSGWGVKATIAVPSYAPFHAKIQEIERLTVGEEDQLNRIGEKAMQESLRTERSETRTTVA